MTDSQESLFQPTMRTAQFSGDRVFRYWLQIVENSDLPLVAFVCLNPSTANKVKDDNTVRKCRKYARKWGYGGVRMLNLFAYRATDPLGMVRWRALGKDVVGPANELERLLRLTIEGCTVDRIVAAWGSVHTRFGLNGDFIIDRGREVFGKISPMGLEALQFTKDGHPRHPLYLKDSCDPIAFDRYDV